MKKQSAVFLWLGVLAILGGAGAYLVSNAQVLNEGLVIEEKAEKIFLTGPTETNKTYSEKTTLTYSSSVSGGIWTVVAADADINGLVINQFSGDLKILPSTYAANATYAYTVTYTLGERSESLDCTLAITADPFAAQISGSFNLECNYGTSSIVQNYTVTDANGAGTYQLAFGDEVVASGAVDAATHLFSVTFPTAQFNTGNHPFVLTYTETGFTPISHSGNLKIRQVTPTVNASLPWSTITYGTTDAPTNTLSASVPGVFTLSQTLPTGFDVTGSAQFLTIKPLATLVPGVYSYTVEFVPTDAVNYATVTTTCQVVVTNATNAIHLTSTALAEIDYQSSGVRQYVADYTRTNGSWSINGDLPGATIDDAGTLTWPVNLPVGTYYYNVIYNCPNYAVAYYADSFTVKPIPQTIVAPFTNDDLIYGVSANRAYAAVNSGGTWSLVTANPNDQNAFAIDESTGIVTIADTLLPGTYTYAVTYECANYLPATLANQTVTVVPSNNLITGNFTPALTYGDSNSFTYNYIGQQLGSWVIVSPTVVAQNQIALDATSPALTLNSTAGTVVVSNLAAGNYVYGLAYRELFTEQILAIANINLTIAPRNYQFGIVATIADEIKLGESLTLTFATTNYLTTDLSTFALELSVGNANIGYTVVDNLTTTNGTFVLTGLSDNYRNQRYQIKVTHLATANYVTATVPLIYEFVVDNYIEKVSETYDPVTNKATLLFHYVSAINDNSVSFGSSTSSGTSFAGSSYVQDGETYYQIIYDLTGFAPGTSFTYLVSNLPPSEGYIVNYSGIYYVPYNIDLDYTVNQAVVITDISHATLVPITILTTVPEAPVESVPSETLDPDDEKGNSTDEETPSPFAAGPLADPVPEANDPITEPEQPNLVTIPDDEWVISAITAIDQPDAIIPFDAITVVNGNVVFSPNFLPGNYTYQLAAKYYPNSQKTCAFTVLAGTITGATWLDVHSLPADYIFTTNLTGGEWSVISEYPSAIQIDPVTGTLTTTLTASGVYDVTISYRSTVNVKALTHVVQLLI